MTILTSSTSSSEPGWRSALLFAALVCALVGVLHVVARFAEGPRYIGELREKLEVSPNADVIVLGPSTAKRLMPDAMCLEGSNLAEGGQDFFEVEALARHLIEKGVVPKTWIIGAVPGMAHVDNGEEGSVSAERRELTYRTLQSLGDWRLIDGDWRTALRMAAMPALGHRDWRLRVDVVMRRLRGEPFARIRPELSNKRLAGDAADRAFAVRWGARNFAAHRKIAYHDHTVAERAVESALRINRVLRSHGAQVVLVYTPLSPAMRQVFEAELPQQYATAKAMKSKLAGSGIIVIDDMAHEDFAEDLGNFLDSVHLNNGGGQRHSRDLAERLAAAGVIPQPRCPLNVG